MKAFRLLLLAALVVFASFDRAQANGYGVYFDYGNVFDAEVDNFDYEEDQYGVGFSFDTNVATDRLFNYRLDAGYQHVEQDFGSFGTADSDGLAIENTFGFGVLRRNDLRLWVGPGIRASFDFFDGTDSWDFGLGVGPTVGVNFHTGPNVSLGLSLGYQMSYVVAVIDSFDDQDGYEQRFFVKLTVLFRSADDHF
jgi:hypothetical protein